MFNHIELASGFTYAFNGDLKVNARGTLIVNSPSDTTNVAGGTDIKFASTMTPKNAGTIIPANILNTGQLQIGALGSSAQNTGFDTSPAGTFDPGALLLSGPSTGFILGAPGSTITNVIAVAISGTGKKSTLRNGDNVGSTYLILGKPMTAVTDPKIVSNTGATVGAYSAAAIILKTSQFPMRVAFQKGVLLIDLSLDLHDLTASFSTDSYCGILGDPQEATYFLKTSCLQWFVLNNGDRTYNIADDTINTPGAEAGGVFISSPGYGKQCPPVISYVTSRKFSSTQTWYFVAGPAITLATTKTVTADVSSLTTPTTVTMIKGTDVTATTTRSFTTTIVGSDGSSTTGLLILVEVLTPSVRSTTTMSITSASTSTYTTTVTGTDGSPKTEVVLLIETAALPTVTETTKTTTGKLDAFSTTTYTTTSADDQGISTSEVVILVEIPIPSTTFSITSGMSVTTPFTTTLTSTVTGTDGSATTGVVVMVATPSSNHVSSHSSNSTGNGSTDNGSTENGSSNSPTNGNVAVSPSQPNDQPSDNNDDEHGESLAAAFNTAAALATASSQPDVNTPAIPYLADQQVSNNNAAGQGDSLAATSISTIHGASMDGTFKTVPTAATQGASIVATFKTGLPKSLSAYQSIGSFNKKWSFISLLTLLLLTIV
ncbi:hypothetical protein C6P44_002414 [Monosporozyma unispora]|nr:hypothetical protein C6P44_002414 [Kazachstania unispora]